MTEGTAVNFQSLRGEDPERPLHYLGYLHDHLEARVGTLDLQLFTLSVSVRKTELSH